MTTPKLPGASSGKGLNRDEDMKPGRPPRSAAEPAGAEGSSVTDKTMTDPQSGAPNRRPPSPTQTTKPRGA
jgi:hypothetical protein